MPKIQKNPFKNQFKNLSITKDITCIKNDTPREGQIKAITGATVSSRAVVNTLNKRIKEIKELLNKN